jgi:hypothetical protein
MKKHKLIEQETTTAPQADTIDKLRDVYKCSFLLAYNPSANNGKGAGYFEKDVTVKGGQGAYIGIAAIDAPGGQFVKGDKVYIWPDYTFVVCKPPFEKMVKGADGKMVKKSGCNSFSPTGADKNPEIRYGRNGLDGWVCKARQKETVSAAADTQNLNQSQIDYIDEVIKIKGYIKLTPQQQSEVDSGKYAPVDLYYENAKLFPEKGKYILYKRSGETQMARSTPQQDEIINDLIKKKYVKDEPAISESDKYIRVNLRTLEGGKYAQYFQKDFFMWQPISEVNPQEILAKRKQTLDAYSVNRKECRQTIDTLHTFWAKGIPFDSDSDRIQLKNHAKRCLKQKEFGRGVDKKVAKLASLPKTEPFSLAESKQDNMKSMIHENLIHLSQNKKKIILEQDIVKHRIGFVFESYDKHQNIDKLLSDLIYEYSYLHNQGFDDSLLFEQDGSLIGWGLGRIGGGGVDVLKERFIQGILQAMGVDPNGWFATILSISFGNLQFADLPKLFRFDCGYITGLISKTMLETIIKKFVKFGDKGDVISDMLRNTLDSMFRDSFEDNFQEMLKNKLCPILARFSNNATQVNKELETKVMS